MLIWLANLLAHYWHTVQVIDYVTLRCVMAALTALLISLFAGKKVIRYLQRMQLGQIVREDGPKAHAKKTGTPTMGGLLIISSISLSAMLWSNWSSGYFWVALLTLLGFGIIGWLDDYLKIIHKNPNGLRAKYKYLLQSALAILVSVWLFFLLNKAGHTDLFLPFVAGFSIHLGLVLILLSYFVIVGSSNAVNLTDGLDGLAIMPVILVAAGFAVFAYSTSNANFAHYLLLPFIPKVGELGVFCASIIGAGLGFLWFNTYPAQIFMGDVGSLSLGAVLGVIAIAVRQELLLVIMGGIFVAETLSVIIQVGYFKITGGKRVFLMAPLHHHFELKGWSEPKIIVRFWIITAILVLIGLASLKLR